MLELVHLMLGCSNVGYFLLKDKKYPRRTKDVQLVRSERSTLSQTQPSILRPI